MTRLGISVSFGLLKQRHGRSLWTHEEQLAVSNLVADLVDRGGSLPAEFLYLPLMLGGLLVSSQLQLQHEDLEESITLLRHARLDRHAQLAANPELTALLDDLLH